jgi:hypothetical protein
MASEVSRHVDSGAVGRAMFREIAYAPDAAAVKGVLCAYLAGPASEEAIHFLAAYLCRAAAGFLPNPERLDP